jgi:hypothetical protein
MVGGRSIRLVWCAVKARGDLSKSIYVWEIQEQDMLVNEREKERRETEREYMNNDVV